MRDRIPAQTHAGRQRSHNDQQRKPAAGVNDVGEEGDEQGGKAPVGRHVWTAVRSQGGQILRTIPNGAVMCSACVPCGTGLDEIRLLECPIIPTWSKMPRDRTTVSFGLRGDPWQSSSSSCSLSLAWFTLLHTLDLRIRPKATRWSLTPPLRQTVNRSLRRDKRRLWPVSPRRRGRFLRPKLTVATRAGLRWTSALIHAPQASFS